MKYIVCLRTGGTHDCTWRKVSETFSTSAEALQRAIEIENVGYKAHVYPDYVLRAVGLPVGWEPGIVDWQHDTITYSPDETHHKKAFVKKSRNDGSPRKEKRST